MPSLARCFARIIPLFLILATLLWLTGCLVLDSSGPTSPVVVNKLQIEVRSGQHPVAGATIQLYETNLDSYTGTSFPRLLLPVVTGTDGNYTASTVLLCNPNALFYLVATGGDVGHGSNPAISLMTAIGSCDALATSTIVINEATTVASVYAVAGFTTSVTSVSANAAVSQDFGTKLALTGLRNAFAAADNLVDIHTGMTRASTLGGNGTVPRAKINSLANLLASCVESAGSGSPACTGLFAGAPSRSGVAPVETVQAILNIAHNPGVNIPVLYALAGGSPYSPALTSVPNDLTLSIPYNGTGTGRYQALAADSNGSIWVTATSTVDSGSVIEFDFLGRVANTLTGGATGISSPSSIAIDPSNNVWIQNCQSACNTLGETNSLSRIADGGYPVTTILQANGFLYSTNGLASDGAGNIYSSIYTVGSPQSAVEKYSNTGTPITGNFPLPASFGAAVSLAIDGAGNLGVLTPSGPALFYNTAGTLTRTVTLNQRYGSDSKLFYGGAFDHAGNYYGVGADFVQGHSFSSDFALAPTATTASPGDAEFTGGVTNPQAVVVDGAGTEWIANSYATDVSAFTSAGVPLSPTGVLQPPYASAPTLAAGFQAGFASGSLSIAVDISGNVWIADAAGTRVAEYVGAAVPVTPLAVGVKYNTVGQRP